MATASTNKPWSSVISETMGIKIHLRIIQRYLLHPIRWLTSRDSSRLNNLGVALMGIGATDAVTTGAAKLPWWSITVGLAMFAAGLVLTVYTMGATVQSTMGTSSKAGEDSETQRPTCDPKIEMSQRQTIGRELRVVTDGDAIFTETDQSPLHSTSILPADTRESNHGPNPIIGISGVHPLPIAADFHSQIVPVIEQFESLEDPPDPPRRATESAVFRWSVEMATWIRDVEVVLDASYRLAKSREREGFPSVELAQKAADARAGLQKLRNLIRQTSELTDWNLDPAIPLGIREDVASIVALAVNS
jgi:hypothetical protein